MLSIMAFVHRTLIQLDETLYQQIRSLAYEKGVSFSAAVRDLLSKAFAKKGSKKKKRIESFKFIGSGRSKEPLNAEEHDKYLAEDFLK